MTADTGHSLGESCCIKGCDGLISSAFMCKRHYTALWRYGHPLGKCGSRYDVKSQRKYKPQMREKWAWRSMLTRCYKPTSDNYCDYGARGISVCDRWRDSFENFFADMGEKPNGYSLERIDFNGNYELGNCRWATTTDQNRNKRSVVLDAHTVSIAKRKYADGESVANIARWAGVKYFAMWQAIKGISWKDVEAA